MLNKEAVIKIVKDHFAKIDIFQVVDISLETKAHRTLDELPAVYDKLNAEKLLPEIIDKNTFMHFMVNVLNQSIQEAQLYQAFGGMMQ